MNHVPIDQVALLSNLKLSGKEMSELGGVLDETVSYVDNLNELNTTGTVPTSSPTGTTNHFFEDGENNSRSLPAGKYVVKRII